MFKPPTTLPLHSRRMCPASNYWRCLGLLNSTGLGVARELSAGITTAVISARRDPMFQALLSNVKEAFLNLSN